MARSLSKNYANVNKKVHLSDWCKLHRKIQKDNSRKREGSPPAKRTEYKHLLIINKLAECLLFRTYQGSRCFLVTAKYLGTICDTLKSEDEKRVSVSATKNRLRCLKDLGLISVRNLGRKGMLIRINNVGEFNHWLEDRVQTYRKLVPLKYNTEVGQKVSTYIGLRDINKYYNNNITNTRTDFLENEISRCVFSAIKQDKAMQGLSRRAKTSAFRDIRQRCCSLLSRGGKNDLFAIAKFCTRKYSEVAQRYGFDERPEYHISPNSVKSFPSESLSVSATAALRKAKSFIHGGYTDGNN